MAILNEVHSMKKGATESIISHGKADCDCDPIRNTHPTKATGYWTVTYVHKDKA